jgi:hypothetical protein
MKRQRSQSRKNGGNTPSITDEQFMELLDRVAPGAKALGPVRRLDARGQREAFSVPVLVDEAQLKARSLREGRKIIASLSRVERRLLAGTALSRLDRRALAAAIRDARTVVTPLLVGFE